jgi:hypothetical protein
LLHQGRVWQLQNRHRCERPAAAAQPPHRGLACTSSSASVITSNPSDTMDRISLRAARMLGSRAAVRSNVWATLCATRCLRRSQPLNARPTQPTSTHQLAYKLRTWQKVGAPRLHSRTGSRAGR